MADSICADIMKAAREAAAAVKGNKVPESVCVMIQEATKLLLEHTNQQIEQKVTEIKDIHVKEMSDMKDLHVKEMTDVKDFYEGQITDLKDQLSSRDATLADIIKDKNEIQHQVDAVSQYNRRDNVKITGVPYAEGENLVEIVNDIAQHIGASAPDASTIHRIFTKDDTVVTTASGRRTKHPSIIMRMVRRTSKFELMDKRKVLRTQPHPNYPDMAIYEDLTPLRSRILYALRNREDAEGHKVFKFTWTKEGRIYCRTEEESKKKLPNGKQPKPHIVNRLEDLSDLGFTQEEINGIGNSKRH